MEDKFKKHQKHLGDVLNAIDFILVYNDINDAHFFNFLSTPLDEDVDDITDSADAARLAMTDAQLKTISDDDVHKITNIELLDRICKVDKTKLSDAQRKTLIALYKQKFIVDEKDVEKLLECIKKCDKLFTEKRPVNMTFMNTYGLNDADVLKILRGMTVADYYCNTRSININHLGNNLLIFEPVVNLGAKRQKICIYIKLDIDETTKDCVMLVSIHAGDIQPTPHGEKQLLNAGLLNNKQQIITESRQQTAVKSNGVYSVLKDAWIKEPVAEDIPEINEEEFEKLFKEWEDKYFALLDEVK